MLYSLGTDLKKNLIVAIDFSLFIDTTFEAKGSVPYVKKYLAELIDIKKCLIPCGIWKLGNLDLKQFTLYRNIGLGLWNLR